MKIRRQFLLPIVFVSFAGIALMTAGVVVGVIEQRTAEEVRSALTLEDQSWVDVEADGLLVRMTGTAETEAVRFRALAVAGAVVDAARIIDAMEVRPAAQLRAPEFSVEVLRNDDGISLIGLIPATEDREAVVARLSDLAATRPVSDMLETADYPVPEGWQAALDFGLSSLSRLPRSKISITPERVTITAITTSAEEKARLESDLARDAPPGLRLTLELSAPRPVITPFTLRFLIDGSGARFDACSADTEVARTRILSAAVAAGAEGKSDCTIGLGVPSPRWTQAVEVSIASLAELGAGSLTFSDADISLIAADTVAQEDFDRVIGELERALPDAFSLTAVLTPKAEPSERGPPEFIASLDAEGQLRMRGRLTSERVRTVVDSFAAARFGGAGRVYNAARIDPELPEGWPVRVLAALEALDELASGSVLVRPDLVRITGQTGSPGASAEIARLLAQKLGEGKKFEIEVTYVETLDPVAALPTPEECVVRVNAILAERKITFAPGSADIEGEGLDTLDLLSEALKDCATVRMEIGAHSDSQGREEMNLTLSQARADSVLNGLLARRVLTSNLTAAGYGEARPIADNGTEEGREANRRIEFTLVLPEEEGAAAEEAAAGEGAAETEAGAGAAEAEPAAEDPAGSANEQN
ncbi:MAG: OmpA family protein [Paracoccaceae bacterium]|nr:OmpA family protein [Paracoccaceae bacterium]